jgi:Big-like domain-containing protein
VIRWCGALVLGLILGCSNLNEGEAGVVALEVSTPSPDTLEVGESVQLVARALDRNGNPVSTAISWRSVDTTASIDPATGIVTALFPGTARVQATVGSLASGLITLTVLAPADTLIIAGDSVLTVPTDVAASAAMLVRLESFNPAGPLADRPVIYSITLPDLTSLPHTVELPGAALVDTVLTGSDGQVSTMTLGRVAGVTAPDSAIVEVSAFRLRGAVVPGSGQRFIVHFQ